jgi:tetratricopeptide (TPR) repeat protein
MSPGEAFPKAVAAARKALEIDDSLAPAHATLGLSLTDYDRDWSSAESEFKKAIALDGNYATAHQWYGMLLTELGRFDEALAELSRAKDLDPFSAIIRLNVCRLFIHSRQFDRAIEEGQKVNEMAPTFGPIHNFLSQAYAGKRMTREAIAESETAARLLGRDTPLGLMNIGRAQALAGRRDEALSTVAKMKALSARQYVSPAFMAVVLRYLGDRDQIFEWWDKACDDRSFDVIFLKVDPSLDELRDDPRFAALLRKAGLSP